MKKYLKTIRVFSLLSISFVLFIGTSGCMMNTVKAIGHRTEEFDKYQSFVISGDKLIVQYTKDIRATDPTPCHGGVFYIERTVANDVENWGVVDLDSGWRTPEINNDEKRLNWWGRSTYWWTHNGISLSHSEGQPPQKNENYVDLMPHEESWYQSMEKVKPDYMKAEQTMKQQIQECLGDSLYCINYPYGHNDYYFVILKKDNESKNVQYKAVAVKENRYYESGSKVVHFILMPFAFIYDIALFPFSMLSLFCM